jgi:hypothetical protein
VTGAEALRSRRGWESYFRQIVLIHRGRMAEQRDYDLSSRCMWGGLSADTQLARPLSTRLAGQDFVDMPVLGAGYRLAILLGLVHSQDL